MPLAGVLIQGFPHGVTTWAGITKPAGNDDLGEDQVIEVDCVGGGGAGGSETGGTGTGAGGGGGGAYARTADVRVLYNTGYSVSQGDGGVGVNDGGDSSFVGEDESVIAKGGATGSGSTGGAGGSAAASTGDTKYDGGAGGDGTPGVGGGGGGGGASGNQAGGGTIGSGVTGGAGSGVGGSGGNGSDGVAVEAVDGRKPGGGGGGGGETVGVDVGAEGGRGIVRVAYRPVVVIITPNNFGNESGGATGGEYGSLAASNMVGQ